VTFQFAGRVAVVTGAGSGIGLASVSQLAAAGATVLGVDRDPAGCARLDALDSVTALEVDVTDGAAATAIAEAVRELGGIDILVNNAGATPTRSGFLDAPVDAWRRSFELNLFAAVSISAALLPGLIERRGVIINVASTSGRYPEPMLVDYAASKAALLSLTGSLATEFGAAGVRVVAVSPGPTRTELWDRPGGFVDSIAERYGLDREAAVDHHIRTVRGVALGIPATAADVANAISFLASDAASHITGITLPVHGGMATHLM
jgi:NAD(P)-dependent dehydrogenase (short-subunit alcohol dehydrogenase family)